MSTAEDDDFVAEMSNWNLFKFDVVRLIFLSLHFIYNLKREMQILYAACKHLAGPVIFEIMKLIFSLRKYKTALFTYSLEASESSISIYSNFQLTWTLHIAAILFRNP